jgi:hypothetical protein
MQRVLEVSAALSLAGGIAAIFIAARRSNRLTASIDSTPLAGERHEMTSPARPRRLGIERARRADHGAHETT